MGQPVAIFGGSFNPPHLGHVLAAALVLATHDVEKVLVIPTYRHPFAKALAGFEDRVEMCARAMRDLRRVEISRVEEELGGESKTLLTLEHLRRRHPDWSMKLVLGSDAFAESAKWFRFDEVQRLAEPLVLARAKGGEAPASGAVLPAISSTDVRAAIARGDWERVLEVVPRAVVAHIRERSLYAASEA